MANASTCDCRFLKDLDPNIVRAIEDVRETLRSDECPSKAVCNDASAPDKTRFS